ncbi:pimeloyl-ACP methyl ester esterase BioH [Idiomarina seosinensis]|uniref:pimeloyl-ACP methyl ester esterase BioH n=1 Tax=Idiomarina seosinensis TaxID=281739 RepID=UPI00384BA06E
MAIWQQSVGVGEDIVVLHGWGMNANVWSPLINGLSSDKRITAVDLPGFGDSHDELFSANLEDVSAALLAVLPQRFHLIGWSLGGLVATEMALRAPDRIATLTTVASSPCFVEQPQWPGIKSALLQQFQRQLSKDFKQTVERFLAVQAMGSPHAKEQIKQVREWVFSKPMANPESLRNGLSALQTTDLRAHLSSLNMPLYRIYGRLDSLVPASVIPLVDKLAPDSDAMLYRQSAHMPFVSATSEFVEQYRRFLNRHQR